MHVDAVGKGDGHDRQTRNGLGAQGREPRRAVDGILNLFGDELFDLLRAQSRGLRSGCRLATVRTPGNTSKGERSAPQEPRINASSVSAVTAPKWRTHSVTSARIMVSRAAESGFDSAASS